MLLHWSFLLLLMAGAYWGYKQGLAINQLVWWSLFGVAVFSSILLHEFGHVLVARRFGVETKDIVLLPIGGLARLRRLPDKPFQEFLVAIAGPLVNVCIAFLLAPFFWFITRPELVQHEIPTPNNIDEDYFFFLPLLLFLNILLAVFNMIPAFPMDGGRILRALLSVKWGRLKATKVAVAIGQIIAVVIVITGVWFGNYSYAIIGIFISYTAMKEYRWVKAEHLLSGHKVADAFAGDCPHLSINDDMEVAFQIFNNNNQRGFLVFDESGNLAGTFWIDENATSFEANKKVNEVYRPSVHLLDVTDTLKEANEKMTKHGSEVLPVYENGLPVGILENEMIWEYLSNKG